MNTNQLDLSILTVNKEKYRNSEKEILESNSGVLKIFSLIAICPFALLLIISFFSVDMEPNRILYISYMIVFFVFFVVQMIVGTRYKWLNRALPLTFTLTLFSYGIVLGTILRPNNMTVSYIVLLMAIPLLFAARPIAMNGIILLSMLIYITLAYMTQPAEIFRNNLVDVIIYGVLSMFVSSYMMKVKVQRVLYKNSSATLKKSDTVNRERIETVETFVTDMIRYSSEAEDVDNTIKQIMEYIGTKLNSDRAYIFEKNENGTFDNTYEWVNKGVTAEIDNLQGLEYEGLIEIWIEQYKKSHNILIYDIEEYKKVSQAMYDLLKPQGIHSLVTGPITINGDIIGFYGVDNPPVDTMDQISELINLMEFVVSMMIRLRDDARELERSAYYDQLTGSKNRKALDWAYDGRLDMEASLTAILCDLNGLKEVNDKQGHEAGDKFICRTVDILNGIFGKENVYRMGGDEFSVVLIGKTREQIDELMELCKIQIGTTACIGVAYTEKAEYGFNKLMMEADKEMYHQKDLFYQSRRKYREV